MGKITHNYKVTIKFRSGDIRHFESGNRKEGVGEYCTFLTSCPWVAVRYTDSDGVDAALVVNTSRVEYFTVKEVTE